MKHLLFTTAFFIVIFISQVSRSQMPDPPLQLIQQVDDWDAKSVLLPESDFPIAGIRFYEFAPDWTTHTEANLWKQAGLNVLYNDRHAYKRISGVVSTITDHGNLHTVAQQLTKGMKSYIWFGELCGPHFEGVDSYGSADPEKLAAEHQILPYRDRAEATEMRYFLASNFDKLTNVYASTNRTYQKTFAYDLVHPWGIAIGNQSSTNKGQEWKVDRLDVIDNTKGVFATENEIILGQMNSNNFSRVDLASNKIYCDFIYRIDGEDWSGDRVPGTTAGQDLFWIEYYVEYAFKEKGATRTDFSKYLKKSGTDGRELETAIHKLNAYDPITYNEFLSFVYPPGTKDDIKYFPNGDRFMPRQGVQSRQYAINRFVTNSELTQADGSEFNSSQYDFPIIGIRCVVKSKHLVDIHVRGIRVRSELGEQILSGSLDNDLKSIFGSKRAALKNLTNGLTGAAKISAWDNMPMFVSQSEPTMSGFRTHAYVDELCYRTIGKHVIPFISNNVSSESRPEWFRAIYEEETQKVPPPISMEDLERFDMPLGSTNWQHDPNNAFPIPADGIDFSLRNDLDFYNTAGDLFYITGKKFGTSNPPLAQQLTNQNAGKTGIYDYQYYTQYIQNRWKDIEPYTFSRACRATNPDWALGNDNLSSKYYAHISTITSIETPHTGKLPNSQAIYDGAPSTPNNKKTISQKIVDMLRGANGENQDNNPGNRKIVLPYLDYRNLTFAETSGALPASVYRPAIRTEIRSQLWYGLCYGAKGIVFNPINTDLGGNIGWLQNTYINKDGISTDLKTIDYTLSGDHSFTDFLGGFTIGDCDHPAVPVAQNLSEQSSTDKFNAHIVKLTCKKGSDDFTVFQTIPLFKSDGNALSSQTDIDNYVTANPNNFNTELTNNGFTNLAAHWVFVGQENWDCSTLQDPVTRSDSRGTFPKFGHGGNVINTWEMDNYGFRPFYQLMFHYPQAKITPRVAMTTFYAFKEKNIGSQRAIKDVLPIANTLSKLRWISGVNYSELFNTTLPSTVIDGYWNQLSNFPIQIDRSASVQNPSIKSLKFKRFGQPWQLLEMSDIQNDIHIDDKYPNASTDGLEDLNVRKYYELGLFVDPSQDPNFIPGGGKAASQYFMIIANNRTWPMYIEGGNILQYDPTSPSGSPYEYLGGVDARRFKFKINKSMLDPTNQFKFYTVSNLSSGSETYMASYKDEYHDIDLEPGQGTLLRIAPTTSLSAGKTDEDGMAYNNGHRIAEIPNTGISPRRALVWEKNGNIELNVTNYPHPHVALENIFATGTLATNVFESTQYKKGQNPSVACREGEIVIVYSTQTTNSGGQVLDREVIAEWWKEKSTFDGWERKAKRSLDAHYLDANTDGHLPLAANQPKHLITPVITPGRDGYFVAWSNADNAGMVGQPEHYIEVAHIRLDNVGGTDVIQIDRPINNKIRSDKSPNGTFDPNVISEVFPSVASRDEIGLPDEFGNLTSERFHMAWQTNWNDGSSHIYYTNFNRNLGNGTITNSVIQRVSKRSESCQHLHPNIAVQNNKSVVENTVTLVRGYPIVTWEKVNPLKNRQTMQAIDQGSAVEVYDERPSTAVVVRRNIGGIFWSSFTSIYPAINNLPLPLVQPGISVLSGDGPFTQRITPFFTVTYNDTLQKQIRVSRVYQSRQSLSHTSYKLPETGMYSNLSLNYKLGTQTFGDDPIDLKTLTFRGNYKITQDDGSVLYHARVTAPLAETLLKKVSGVDVVTLNALATEACKQKFAFSVGNPNKRPAIWCTGCSDTVYFTIGTGIPIWFNNYDITDTRPGYYSESDTTIFNWPRTEDSIRTEDFVYSLGDTLSFDRIFVLEDTAWVKTLINDSTFSHINYSVLLKDSASGSTIATLDRIQIDTASIDIAVKRFGEDNITVVSPFLPPMPSPTSFYMPQGPGRKIQWVANMPAPSGKAYITVHASKDYNMPVVMSQENGAYDDFSVILPIIDTTIAFKQAGQQPTSPSVSTTPVTLSINPNPFEGSTRVTVETVKDVPLSIQVYNVLGGLVTDLYNEMSTHTHYEFTLDSKVIRPGTYFIRAQAGNGTITKKVQFIK